MPASKTTRDAPEPEAEAEPKAKAEPKAESPPTKPVETAAEAEAIRTKAGAPEAQPRSAPEEPPIPGVTQAPPEPVVAFDRWADRETVSRYGPEAVGGFGAAMREAGTYFGTAAEWEARLQGWLEEPSSMVYPEGEVPPAG